MRKIDNSSSEQYLETLFRQDFGASELDYSLFEKRLPILQSIANIGNSGISVFDLFLKKHIFYSPNYGQHLGYNLEQIRTLGQEFLDTRIHPDDFKLLEKNGIALLKFFYDLTTEEKGDYKLINEFRVLDANNNYVRVIEQHQILELDSRGNLWLSLSIIDISPNQNSNQELVSQLYNFKTNVFTPFIKNDPKSGHTKLSKREVQILKMVKDGLLSKEISSSLDISLHTVNKHRQRVLEKLGANNSLEAILFATKLGLV